MINLKSKTMNISFLKTHRKLSFILSCPLRQAQVRKWYVVSIFTLNTGKYRRGRGKKGRKGDGGRERERKEGKEGGREGEDNK